MQVSSEEIYTKLLGETATISWNELQPFFARGVLHRVSGALDLIEVARRLAENDQSSVSVWLTEGALQKIDDDQAQDWLERDPTLWCVVVAPWVLVQERRLD